MGRTYLFDCSRCGYRAKVSGKADHGFTVCVQTVVCLDCKKLYDAVTRVKRPIANRLELQTLSRGPHSWKLSNHAAPSESCPTFQSAVNRLAFTGGKRQRWVDCALRCPVAGWHRVQEWNEPDKCPKCGTYLERHALPYRIWD
jgi:hypothetical protein